MTKPKCLGALLNTLGVRKYAQQRAADFVKRFPWRGFLLQAPQAAYTLTGYGVVLGSIMGFMTDAIWATVRAPWHGLPTWNGPPPSDPVSKAARYISQPPYHLNHSAVFSYEDHWILNAADRVAMTLLTQFAPASVLDARSDFIAGIPPIEFRPWYPPTLQVLGEMGIDPAARQAPLIDGLTAESTYAEVLSLIALGFPAWAERVRLEFPASTSATAFMSVLSDTGHDFFTWSTDGADEFRPIFAAEELTIAKLFEWGVFPPREVEAPEVDLFLQRALEISAAAGHDLPRRSDVILAMDEVLGGHVER